MSQQRTFESFLFSNPVSLQLKASMLAAVLLSIASIVAVTAFDQSMVFLFIGISLLVFAIGYGFWWGAKRFNAATDEYNGYLASLDESALSNLLDHPKVSPRTKMLVEQCMMLQLKPAS
ncbi:hypothetical protein IC617_08690 [Neiella sp. HB171785]|uniref:Uncharacterized protein n=1 Tax=Neiella litorisoli TaxID=2771431 RepID=A0A8J6QUU1_9GAMM|nr:hypothetical protein [Neiella litorisoli]MBD1389503.1 hypothetical protein [Neiella litorisoli]